MRCQQLWTVFAGNIQSRVISPRNEGNNSPNSPSPPSPEPAPLQNKPNPENQADHISKKLLGRGSFRQSQHRCQMYKHFQSMKDNDLKNDSEMTNDGCVPFEGQYELKTKVAML